LRKEKIDGKEKKEKPRFFPGMKSSIYGGIWEKEKKCSHD